MRRSIIWFKTDLRLHDNETLMHALQNSDEVLPVYCFDENHFRTTEFGSKKTGSWRAKFLLESLIDLDCNLRALGSGLIVVKGKPETELCKIIETYGITTIYAKHEIGYEEHVSEKHLIFEAFKRGCLFKYFDTSSLYDAQALPFPIRAIPEVFTDFRKEVEKTCSVKNPLTKPQRINSPEIPPLKLPSFQELDLDEPTIDERAVIIFKGGESEALKRLNYYFFETQLISNYKITRNRMIGGNYSSKFSSWLAMGCLSARQIYFELKNYEANFGANDSTYWLVFELLWRDYFRFMMEKHGTKYFLKNGIKQNHIANNNFDKTVLQKWIGGKTGNAFIDANMIELKQTGFMSNRGRQNVASYLVNDLNIDWRYGAAYFEQQLIDYDVSSNWGNWAYVAGVGNDPRGKRYFNIEKQANDYDGNYSYRTLWLNI